MDKVLVNHNNGAAAVTGPKEVTERTVRVCRDMLDVWRFSVCSIECQNEPGESTLQNTVDQARQVKTVPRNTQGVRMKVWFNATHSSKKRRNRDVYTFPTRGELTTNATSDRQVVWTNTQCTVKAEEQTSLFKWMSNNCHCHAEVTKFAERSWFRSSAKQFYTGRTVERCPLGRKVETNARDQRFDSLSRSRSKTSSC